MKKASLLILLSMFLASAAFTSAVSAARADDVCIGVNSIAKQESITENFDGSITVRAPRLLAEGRYLPVIMPNSTNESAAAAMSMLCGLYGKKTPVGSSGRWTKDGEKSIELGADESLAGISQDIEIVYNTIICK